MCMYILQSERKNYLRLNKFIEWKKKYVCLYFAEWKKKYLFVNTFIE